MVRMSDRRMRLFNKRTKQEDARWAAYAKLKADYMDLSMAAFQLGSDPESDDAAVAAAWEAARIAGEVWLAAHPDRIRKTEEAKGGDDERR